MRLPNADGTQREAFVAALKVKIKKLPGKRRVAIVTKRPQDPASDEELRFVLADLLQSRNDTVARLYALRNWVEVFYSEAKGELGAGQYQVRDLTSIVRHWRLVFVAYSLVVKLRRDGLLARRCKKTLHHPPDFEGPARLPAAALLAAVAPKAARYSQRAFTPRELLV